MDGSNSPRTSLVPRLAAPKDEPRPGVEPISYSPIRPPVGEMKPDLAAAQLRAWLDQGMADAQAGRVVEIRIDEIDRLFERLKEQM